MKEKKERKLSAAEQRRQEALEQKTIELEKEGYVRRDLIIDIMKANIFVLVLMIPVFALGILLFFAANRDRDIALKQTNPFLLLLAYLILIVVHELIHGATWGSFTKKGFKDIEFGIMKDSLTPYCTCATPLEKRQYILGALMPLLILGILPTVIAIFIGNFTMLIIGILMILGAGGDMLIVHKILTYRSDTGEQIYLDHPTEAGIIVFER